MQTLEMPPAKHKTPHSSSLPPNLPEGCELQQVAYVCEPAVNARVVMEFREPMPCLAVILGDTKEAEQKPPATLELLLIPTDDIESPDLVASAWNWVEPEAAAERRHGQFITLQGARVIWAPGRAALIASADRLATLRLAVVEFALHESEVRKIEQAVAAAWPSLEADGALSFHYDDRAARQRARLAERYQQVLNLRMRLVRVDPVLHRPPVHPPTLAGQLGERLKERTRLAERIEFLSGQLEVFERVYEQCGHRSNEYLLSRKEHTLEWIIIALLAAETTVLLVELLSSLGTT